MAIATYVVEFEGSSPAVSAGTEIMGGKLIGVQFDDALAEIEELQNYIGDLEAEAGERLVAGEQKGVVRMGDGKKEQKENLKRVMRQNDQLQMLRQEDQAKIARLEAHLIGALNKSSELLEQQVILVEILRTAPVWIKPDDENVYSDGNDETTYLWCKKVNEALEEQ